MNAPRPPLPDQIDRSSPTLLIVSLVTVLAGVAGVIAVAMTTAGWALIATLVVLLVGLTIVVRTMQQQLGEEGDGD